MLQRKSVWSVLLGGFCVVGLTGCFASEVDDTPSTAPIAASTFGSEEEARVAADTAYTNYLAATNSAGQSGGQDTSGLAATTTKDWLAHETNSYVEILQMGRMQQGVVTFDRLILQQVTETTASVHITVYACMDLSQVVTVDTSTGANPLRPESMLHPIEVAFESSDKAREKLVVSSQSPWQGENFCLS